MTNSFPKSRENLSELFENIEWFVETIRIVRLSHRKEYSKTAKSTVPRYSYTVKNYSLKCSNVISGSENRMNIVTDLPCKQAFTNKLRYSDQIEILLDMLIESGRHCTIEERIPHDDVVIVLEFIRERLIDIKDL